MNWFARVITASVGKKLLMALTGIFFIKFLLIHLIGNLTIYGGDEYFNSYVEHLHSLGPIITAFEFIMLFFAVIHISTGLLLFFQNIGARPFNYAVNKNGGGRTIGSSTMPYTGIFILIFLIFHLINFHFVDKTNTTVFDIVSNAFANPIYVAFYVIAVAAASFHVSHGFWSAFQTLGLNNVKYMPCIKKIGVAASILFGIGFGFLPIYMFIM